MLWRTLFLFLAQAFYFIYFFFKKKNWKEMKSLKRSISDIIILNYHNHLKCSFPKQVSHFFFFSRLKVSFITLHHGIINNSIWKTHAWAVENVVICLLYVFNFCCQILPTCMLTPEFTEYCFSLSKCQREWYKLAGVSRRETSHDTQCKCNNISTWCRKINEVGCDYCIVQCNA